MNMVDTYDQLVNIAQIVRKCPTITLARAFTRAYRDFANQSQWLRLDVDGSTTIDQSEYSLGSDPYLEITAISGITGSEVVGSTTQFWTLMPSDSGTWDQNLSTNTSEVRPVRYQYVPQAQFALDPIPKAVYGLTIGVIVQPKENAARVPESALQKYRAAVEAGALEYLLNITGMPWTDVVRGERYGRTFRSGIANAKADVQRSFNTGSVRVRPRTFANFQRW